MPQYAVISVGTGNSYGHPTDNTLSRLRDAGVKVFRTDLQGDIICTSDGQNVSFSVAKNADADTFASVTTQYIPPAPEPEPEPDFAPVPEPEPEPVGMCWKSATGDKYHSINNCGRMNPNKATYISIAQAESMGLGRCSKCW